MIKLTPERTFRRTVGVHFADINVPGSNGIALEIPVGCYHRSYSGKEGSLLLNHAIRDEEYDETSEFVPRLLPIVDQFPANYHGISFYNVENFIKHGELL